MLQSLPLCLSACYLCRTKEADGSKDSSQRGCIRVQCAICIGEHFDFCRNTFELQPTHMRFSLSKFGSRRHLVHHMVVCLQGLLRSQHTITGARYAVSPMHTFARHIYIRTGQIVSEHSHACRTLRARSAART